MWYDFFRRCCSGNTESNSESNPESKFTTHLHLNAQRANAIVELLNTTIKNAPSSTGPADIATKCAQTIVCFYTAAVSDAYLREKMYHIAQGLVTAAQMGLAIALLFNDENCSAESKSGVCHAVELTQYLFSAMLLITWAPAELASGLSTPSQQVISEPSP